MTSIAQSQPLQPSRPYVPFALKYIAEYNNHLYLAQITPIISFASVFAKPLSYIKTRIVFHTFAK